MSKWQRHLHSLAAAAPRAIGPETATRCLQWQLHLHSPGLYIWLKRMQRAGMVGDVNTPVLRYEVSSIAGTFLYKFILPFVWIFGIGIVLGGVWFDRIKAEPAAKWGCLVVWIVGLAAWWWCGLRLKRVQVGTDAIYVSNFLKEIRIAFDEINDVTQNQWLGSRPVTIHLRKPTSFGRRIVFTPVLRGTMVFKPHAIVGELRALAHLPNQNAQS